MTTESLPPENSITGRSNSAATSRMMVTDSSTSPRNADFTPKTLRHHDFVNGDDFSYKLPNEDE